MNRSAAALGAGAVLLCVAATPVVAAATSNDATPRPSSFDTSRVETVDQSGALSDSSLAGTGATFLLVGMATVGAARRRRWRTVDLCDRTVDVRRVTGKQAHALTLNPPR